MLASAIGRWCVAAMACALLLAPAAGAQDPEIQVDPDSPAGTEYALPTDQARSSGGETPAPAGAGGDQVLFGDGISPPAGEASDGSPQSRAGTPGSQSGDTSASGAGVTAGQARSIIPSAEPSSSALPWLAGFALLVLVLGATAAVAMRRVARPS